jgi:hypothetical protein
VGRLISVALGVILALAGSASLARGGGGHGGGHSGAHHHSTAEHHRSTYAAGVRRDSHGRIERSTGAKDEFRRRYPCPSTGSSRGACPGYVIDHVQALKHGGADAPENMQWQTKADAKAKDRWE